MKTESVNITLQRKDGSYVELEGDVTDLQVITIMLFWMNRVEETVTQEKGVQVLEQLQQIKDVAKAKNLEEDQAFANQTLAFIHKINLDTDYRKKFYGALSGVFGDNILEIKFSAEELGSIISVLSAPAYKFFGESAKSEITVLPEPDKTVQNELSKIRAENEELRKQMALSVAKS